MNKQDLSIVIALVLLLAGWLFFQNKSNAERMRKWQEEQTLIAEQAATNQPPAVLSATAQESAQIAAQVSQPIPVEDAEPRTVVSDETAGAQDPVTDVEEKIFTLGNEHISLKLSSKGGTIASATLAGYRETIEKDSKDICFDYSHAPVLAMEGIKGLTKNSDFNVVASSDSNIVFSASLPSGLEFHRTISLLGGYGIDVKEELINTTKDKIVLPEHAISIGSQDRGEMSKNGLLSVDTLSAVTDKRGNYGKVKHWEKKNLLGALFTGKTSGGCSGAPDGSSFAPMASAKYAEPQKWIALKTRFFAHVFSSDVANTTPGVGYEITAKRRLSQGPLTIDGVSGKILIPNGEIAANASLVRTHQIYIGPKKYSVIRKFAPQSGEIMDFGFSKWLCVCMLPLLNFFNLIFRNYGVAIIVLTILVRLIFWPLTRKSNESMKKMGAIQPQIKELQAKFKDDPQKLQQETMKLYRENNVNPMASCLPMLVQIPVFIALFVVLRSATELRFAPFLWIRDLSEPENLLAGLIPGVPALNILPFVMAGTMFLQSKLTPSMGDPQQQKMMMWMMPLMMFFMFYTMPSALLLYWSVSQLLAIVQLLRQRKARQGSVISPDGVIDGDSLTRQQRRRQERTNG